MVENVFVCAHLVKFSEKILKRNFFFTLGVWTVFDLDTVFLWSKTVLIPLVPEGSQGTGVHRSEWWSTRRTGRWTRASVGWVSIRPVE